GVKAIGAGNAAAQGFAIAPPAEIPAATPANTAPVPEVTAPPAVAPSDILPSDTPAMDAPAPDARAPDTTAGVPPDEGDALVAPDTLRDDQRADILSAVDRA